MSISSIQKVLGARDPETLIGPLFYLFTSLATNGRQRVPATALTEHLMALALHPDVGTALRLAAGALAIEQRNCPRA